MNKHVLFVDDETNILSSYKRNFGRQLQVDTASSGAEGLSLIENQGPYSVIVSDMRMPYMNGIEFLSRARKINPDTTRIILTGQADMNDVINSVNEGQLFRFLTKPCSTQDLLQVVQSGIDQYQLITSEKELLEKTLNGSISVLSHILSLINPDAFSRSDRIKQYTQHLIAALSLDHAWQYEIASMLSQIGLVTVPQEVMKKFVAGKTLTDNEKQMIESSPSISHDLLKDIPRLDKISKMIAWQQENFSNLNDASDYSRPLTEKEQIKTGAQIIKITSTYDTQHNGYKITHTKIINDMLAQPDIFNPHLVSAMKTLAAKETLGESKKLSIFDLTPGMILDQDVKSLNGVFLASKGTSVTLTLIKFLENYLFKKNVEEMIKIRIVA